MGETTLYVDIPEDVDDKKVCKFLGEFCDLTDVFGGNVEIQLIERTSKRL